MRPRFLLDTHVAVRWITAPKKLSDDQIRILREAIRKSEPVALSAVSLLEIAVVFGRATRRGESTADRILAELGRSPAFQIEPFTIELAEEVATLGDVLRDPSDRAIVCTARVCRLRLLTSDRRIIDSGLVPVIA
ncbi:MAG: type II toxin-antitoxin system VapC family toxin [Bryobacteraceae bacterium]